MLNFLARQDGITPLICATYRGNNEMAQLLLQHGADVNAGTVATDMTALMWAAEKCDFVTVKMLLDGGARACHANMVSIPFFIDSLCCDCTSLRLMILGQRHRSDESKRRADEAVREYLRGKSSACAYHFLDRQNNKVLLTSQLLSGRALLAGARAQCARVALGESM